MNWVTIARRCSTSARYPARALDVSFRHERLGGSTATFVADGIEQVDRLDQAFVRGQALGEGDHAPDARRHEDALPQAVLARTEAPPQVGAQLRSRDAARLEPGL